MTLGEITLLNLSINGYEGYFGQNWAPNDPNWDPNDLNRAPKGQNGPKMVTLNNPEQPQFSPNFEFGVEPRMLLPIEVK